jgi:two-component system sensor histidine kinase TorS
LGLAISKEFIEAQHGQLKVTSSLGEGSCFTFSLPLA